MLSTSTALIIAKTWLMLLRLVLQLGARGP
jgi:hypothetical protein